MSQSQQHSQSPARHGGQEGGRGTDATVTTAQGLAAEQIALGDRERRISRARAAARRLEDPARGPAPKDE
jgi:hypothetical protein